MEIDGKSLDVKQQKIDELRAILPEAFTEDQIDWEKLQAALGRENIEFRNERYVLNWAGKSDAFRVLQQSTTATLKPVPEESVNFDSTENIFIEGENLEVLKVLQKSYYGKVKCIIIDPPYNTGSDSFIYPDSFKESKEDYQKRIGDVDEEGYLTKEGFFRRNSKDSGRFHSNWLSMLYPRLFLAKNLLTDDGVIFVHIDDNEVHNLRLMMNEIFGEENFIATIIWEKVHTRKNSSKYFSVSHDYITAYAKIKEVWDRILIPRENTDAYKNPDNDPKGPWKLDPITAHNYYSVDYKVRKPNGVILPRPKGRYWSFSEETWLEKVNNNEVVWGEDSSYPMVKRYFSEVQQGLVPVTLFSRSFAGDSSTAKGELDELLGLPGLFDYPKPSILIKRLEQIATRPNDIILDFFAGSGTTAHAVLDLNKQDGGHRKFIMVQMPEKCAEDSEAYKAGYKTIAEIGKERIRRVIKKIRDESRQLSLHEKKQDLGFKVFKLAPSNFKIWRGAEVTTENLENQLNAFTNPVKENSTKENMLFELILKAGYLLTDKIESKNNCYVVNDGELVIALEKVDQELIDDVISAKPKKVIMLDKLFAGHDQLKTNTVLQMRDNGIEFRTI